MLTLKLLREQPDFVIEKLAVKNFDAAEIVAKILKADELRRSYQTQMDSVLAEQNQKAKELFEKLNVNIGVNSKTAF